MEWARFPRTDANFPQATPNIWHRVEHGHMLAPVCGAYVPAMGEPLAQANPDPHDVLCTACVIYREMVS